MAALESQAADPLTLFHRMTELPEAEALALQQVAAVLLPSRLFSKDSLVNLPAESFGTDEDGAPMFDSPRGWSDLLRLMSVTAASEPALLRLIQFLSEPLPHDGDDGAAVDADSAGDTRSGKKARPTGCPPLR
jgi:hypothetical protein